MEIENEPKSEFDDLLLSAVYQDDGNLLKNHLSTVVNPNLYFNRVYDEENDQRCTLLMIACLNDNEDIINMLLHHFKPNLEVLNDILYEDMNTSQQMFFNVSVLWLAAAINNFDGLGGGNVLNVEDEFDNLAIGTDWRNGEVDTDWQDLAFFLYLVAQCSWRLLIQF